MKFRKIKAAYTLKAEKIKQKTPQSDDLTLKTDALEIEFSHHCGIKEVRYKGKKQVTSIFLKATLPTEKNMISQFSE